jgi:FAD:protein FMN transferase
VTPPAPAPPPEPGTELRETFACFGSECTVIVGAGARRGDAAAALDSAKRALLRWHEQFSRFRADSELTRLNADPRPTVPVSPMMRRIAQAAVDAAARTGGLVDPTLVTEIEEAGYARHHEGPGLAPRRLLALAPARAPAGPRPEALWRAIRVDRRGGLVSRPAGVKLDPGGIAKGVFADELAATLDRHDAFVVDCAGDIRLGGAASVRRAVHVASPFDESTLHTFELASGGIATSGIGKRSWIGPDGRPAHHLLDPARGRPAFTGVVQASALAPTATEAEILSKAAVLSGPEAAAGWLVHGGVIVFDDGSLEVVPARSEADSWPPTEPARAAA